MMRRSRPWRLRAVKQARPNPKLISSALRTAAKATARANVLLAPLASEHRELRRTLQELRDIQDRLHGIASEIQYGGYGR